MNTYKVLRSKTKTGYIMMNVIMIMSWNKTKTDQYEEMGSDI